MIKRLILAIIFLVVVVGGLIGFNLFRSKMIKDFFCQYAAASADGFHRNR